MKKLLLITISTFILTMSLSSFAFALSRGIGEQCNNSDYKCDDGLTCLQTVQKQTIAGGENLWGICSSTLDVLTQRPSSNVDAKNINALPTVTLEGGIGVAIKAILRSAMLLTIIAIVVAAIYFMVSRGKEEDLTKAKDIILYLVIGMGIMAAAYGVVAGLVQFNVLS